MGAISPEPPTPLCGPPVPTTSHHLPQGGDTTQHVRAVHCLDLIARAQPRCQKILWVPGSCDLRVGAPRPRSQGLGGQDSRPEAFQAVRECLCGPDRGQFLCLPFFSSHAASRSSDGYTQEAPSGSGHGQRELSSVPESPCSVSRQPTCRLSLKLARPTVPSSPGSAGASP